MDEVGRGPLAGPVVAVAFILPKDCDILYINDSCLLYTSPEILLSGNHAKVDQWRRQQSVLRTMERRPDLMEQATLTNEELQWIEKYKHI